MNHRTADVAVIGAGSAGLRAYRAAKQWTDNVVLIEGGPYGTTCARVGCMPSKLLIAAAEAAHSVTEAAAFGVEVGPVAVDGVRVMERVRRERDRFVDFVVDDIEDLPAADRILGYARFVDERRLVVDNHTEIEAARIVIATGSSPSFPKAWSALGDRLIVNDDVFDWQDLPSSVAVFGPGVIGLELGQALSRLGVDVKMFGVGGQVGPLTDPEVMASAAASIGADFYLDADANVTRMERSDDAVEIDYVDPTGEVQSTTVDFVIAATGRTPNVGGLDLENTSLPLDGRGVPLFDTNTMQIGDSNVFIAGDVDNDRPLLHEAADEGQIAGDNAARYPDVRPVPRRSPLAVVFTDPQIAMVGETYRALDGQDIVVGEVSFENQGRSRVMLKNRGLLRVYADRCDGRFLGAEMVAPRAEHLGHLLAWSHQAGMTIEQMLGMPYYHPVIEEGLRTALRDARAKLRKPLEIAA